MLNISLKKSKEREFYIRDIYKENRSQLFKTRQVDLWYFQIYNKGEVKEMNVLNDLRNPQKWRDYATHLESQKSVRQDRTALRIAKQLVDSGYVGKLVFPPVIYKVIKQHRNDKPREVYFYPEPYQTLLKFINWSLNQNKVYVRQFSEATLAYLPNRNVTRAVKQVRQDFKKGFVHYFKTDFSNYFNSINPKLLIEELEIVFAEDPNFLELCKTLLRDKRVLINNKVMEKDDKGAMAGLPLSGQWANIFMNRVDKQMLNGSIKYLRYADDILIMSNDELSLNVHLEEFKRLIEEKKIKMSARKSMFGQDSVRFLGFEISAKGIDISEKAAKKLKSSMLRRRKWFSYQVDHGKFGRSRYQALAIYLKGLNKKLYTRESSDSAAWLEWYSGCITTTATLEKIEDYFLKQCSELLGRKDYEQFKRAGYRSLIREYYKTKEQKENKSA